MKKKLAIIDDSAQMREALADWINVFFPDIQIFPFASGEEALSNLRENPVDIVLLDLQLPGMDGFEVAAQLKQNTPETSVLLISVMDAESFNSKVLACGADAFIHKQQLYSRLYENMIQFYQPHPDPENHNGGKAINSWSG